MDTPPSNRLLKTDIRLMFRKGAGRPLLLCLLGLALIPLLVVGIDAYRRQAALLEKEIPRTVRMAAALKRHELQRFFETRMTDTGQLARDGRTRAFFHTLVKRYADTDQPLAEFIDSTVWAKTVSAFDDTLHLHAELHGYDNILLISANGDILYATARGADLSGNLNAPAYSMSSLAAGFRQTLASGETHFLGFSPHPGNGDPMVAFLTAPIDLETTPRAGVLACQIPASAMERQLETAVGLADGLRLYLIDTALTVVAASGIAPLQRLPTTGSPLPEWWRDNHHGTTLSAPGDVVTYHDKDHRWWTGVSENLQVDGHRYGLIAEIDRNIAAAGLTGMRRLHLIVLGLATVATLLTAILLIRRYVSPPHRLVQRFATISGTGVRLPKHPSIGTDIGRLSAAVDMLIQHMEKLKTDNDHRILLLTGLTCLHRCIGGEQELSRLCQPTLDYLAEFLGLQRAEFYVSQADGLLERTCRLPEHPDAKRRKVVSPGEGHVGQAILDQTIIAYRTDAISPMLTAVPQATLANLIAVPLILHHTVNGVLELEKPTLFSTSEIHFVEAAADVIAVALNAALLRKEEALLRQNNREQARTLKMREAALEASASELKAQKQAFQETEHNLRLKQLELEAANAQMAKNSSVLEANLKILEKQKQDMLEQNAALEHAHRELAEKAHQLEISSKYKTDFMANMSHELRTPLNSILLLSRLLLENKDRTMTDRQVEFTRTIHAAGEDLLNLINEILDLAQVESGKLQIDQKTVATADVAGALQEAFAALAEQKGIEFTVAVDPAVPPQLTTDRRRLEQVVKNFLSNAFKFTDAGSIRLDFSVAHEPNALRLEHGDPADVMVAIAVSDTGIGIPADKHAMIFEAFQQLDGSTRRKYGGTGLGLSISRELARLLNGRIAVESQVNKGSRFTLFIPTPEIVHVRTEPVEPLPSPRLVPAADEPRHAQGSQPRGMDPTDPFTLTPETPCILVIHDDRATADTIGEGCRPHGVRMLLSHKLRTGLHFADYYRPKAIFFGPSRPDIDGWAAVRYMKTYPRIRNVPVFSISPTDDTALAVMHGAAGHLRTPATDADVQGALDRMAACHHQTGPRTVLMVTPGTDIAARIKAAAGDDSFHFVEAHDAGKAADLLEHGTIHAAIVDPAIGRDGPRTLASVLRRHPVPLFCYPFGSTATAFQAAFCQVGLSLTFSVIDSADQLVAALAGGLHLSDTEVAGTRLATLDPMAQRAATVLKDRRILLADDDMRTVFAVSSVLEDQGIEVVTGKCGKESLDKLDGFPEIDLMLLDVTMAGMDDFGVIEKIRQGKRYRNTPIIALTAKAMAGDRDRCIAAGADDYLSKPVKSEKLISMLTFWLDPLLASSDLISR